MALRIESELADPTQALATIQAYLAAHPGDLTATTLLADVYRGRLADCTAALPLYRSVAESRDPALSLNARGWEGICAASLGHRYEAIPALEDALRRGVRSPLREEVQLALDALQ